RFDGRATDPVEIATMTECGARHAGDDHAVRDQRCPGHRIAVLGVGRFRAPDLLAGLEVERNHMRVKRGAVEFSVEHRGTTVDDAAAHDSRGVGGYSITDFHICLPASASTAP